MANAKAKNNPKKKNQKVLNNLRASRCRVTIQTIPCNTHILFLIEKNLPFVKFYAPLYDTKKGHWKALKRFSDVVLKSWQGI